MPAVQAEWVEAGSALLAGGTPGEAVYTTVMQVLQDRALAASNEQVALLELQRSDFFHIALVQVSLEQDTEHRGNAHPPAFESILLRTDL